MTSSLLVTPSHEHSWITPRLAVGSGIYSADDVVRIDNECILAVIDCRLTREVPDGINDWFADLAPWITRIHLPTHDHGTEQPEGWVYRGVHYARAALREPSARLLIHCAAGVYRSPALAYAVLRDVGMDGDDAVSLIEQQRPEARPRTYRSSIDAALRSIAASAANAGVETAGNRRNGDS